MVLLRAVASLFARQHLLDIVAGIIIPSLLHLIVRDTSIHLVSPAEYIDIRSLPYLRVVTLFVVLELALGVMCWSFVEEVIRDLLSFGTFSS